MKRSLSLLLSIPMLCALTACGRSVPTAFYALESASGPALADSLPDRTLRIARVAIPAYLDRNGIVSRSNGRSRIDVGTVHVWAEPLADGIARVLNEDLTAPLLAKGLTVLPPANEDKADYTLYVDLLRLDGGVGLATELAAHWTVEKSDGERLGKGLFAARDDAISRSYEDLAAAQSRLVQQLAAYLARRIEPRHEKSRAHARG
ncbi:MAG: PqiC family protein [Desulfovibrio sp.]|nr:PqiC family protein [Desulfovibrio sp.]